MPEIKVTIKKSTKGAKANLKCRPVKKIKKPAKNG